MKLTDYVKSLFKGDKMKRDLNDRDVYKCTENELWYIGDEVLLSDFYKNNAGYGIGTIDPKYSYFYKNADSDIRIVHSGLPSLISNTMARVLLGGGISYKVFEKEKENAKLTEQLEAIYKDNKIKGLLKRSVVAKSWGGKVAWKISVKRDLSEYPIIEKYDAEEFKTEYDRERLQKIIFLTRYQVDKELYELHEEYGLGYIHYSLYLKRGDKMEQVDLGYLPMTENLLDVEFSQKVILAGVIESKPDYDGLVSEFDALDEAWSQWFDEIRTARTNTYIPEVFANNGHFDRFRTRYEIIGSDTSESGQNKITHIQPDIRSDEYKNTIQQLVSNILVNVGLSPYSVGIDDSVGANASGDSLEKREASTLRTRQDAIEEWQEFLQEMSDKLLYAYYRFIKGNSTYKLTSETFVKFGDYITPSRQSIAEFNKGLVEANIIDTEKALDDIYGDELTEEEKIRILANTGNLTITPKDLENNE